MCCAEAVVGMVCADSCRVAVSCDRSVRYGSRFFLPVTFAFVIGYREEFNLSIIKRNLIYQSLKKGNSMPLIYKPYQATLANKEGQKLYYPRLVKFGKAVNTQKMAELIAEKPR